MADVPVLHNWIGPRGHATCARCDVREFEPHRSLCETPPPEGFTGTAVFKYKTEYGVFRYPGENLRATFDFPEMAVEYAEAHGYTAHGCIVTRRIPITPEWETI